MNLEEIAATLKEARTKKGFSQRLLGKKVGLPQSHISKIEQGKVDLQTSSLIQLARVLDLELVLVSRTHLSLVEALNRPHPKGSGQIPAYRLEEEEDV